MEKTSKIITSNHHLPPTLSIKLQPSGPHPHGCGTPPRLVIPPPPRAAVSVHLCFYREKIFCNTQPILDLKCKKEKRMSTLIYLHYLTCGYGLQFNQGFEFFLIIILLFNMILQYYL